MPCMLFLENLINIGQQCQNPKQRNQIDWKYKYFFLFRKKIAKCRVVDEGHRITNIRERKSYNNKSFTRTDPMNKTMDNFTIERKTNEPTTPNTPKPRLHNNRPEYINKCRDIPGTEPKIPAKSFKTRVPTTLKGNSNLVGSLPSDHQKIRYSYQDKQKFLDGWCKDKPTDPPKFIKDSIDCSDIEGTTPKKVIRKIVKQNHDETDKTLNNKIERRLIRDPNNKTILGKTCDTINGRKTHENLDLKTDDVPGTNSKQLIRTAAEGSIRETMYTKDIEGTKSKPYDKLVTKRHINPTDPQYDLPGNFFHKILNKKGHTLTAEMIAKEISPMYMSKV